MGEVLVDFVAPQADDLPSAETFLRAPGGAPANVAVAAARLGARSAFIGAVGDDAFGRFLDGVLRDNDVDTRALFTVPQRTSLAFVARNEGGIPDFLFYRGADEQLDPDHVPEDLITGTRAVHLSSMALLTEPSRSATFRAIDLARQHGVTISVDPNLRPSSWRSMEEAREALFPLLDCAGILKVNDTEALLLTNTETLDDAIGALTRDDRLLVVTLGPDGSIWRWQGEGGQVSAPKVDIVETTGAGDAFVGALLASLSLQAGTGALLDGLTPDAVQDAVRVANAAGALACTKPGAMSSLPRRGEVERLLGQSDAANGRAPGT